jgi:uncharacterized protein with ATP-grasp and redox domains
MKTYLDCIPCFMKQALKAGKIATKDEKLIKEILNKVGESIKDIPLDSSPPETGGLIYKLISDITKVRDPFKEIKKQNIKHALELYPVYLSLVEGIKDTKKRLEMAVKIAAAGNVIDLGVDRVFDLKNDLNDAINADFKIWDFELFYQRLSKAKSILYIGDNSGEAVFDKILIKQFNNNLVFATRDIPVLNDITLEETKLIDLDECCQVISSGVKSPGAISKFFTPDFKEIFDKADLVIAKGQGNYEALSEDKREIFFLLKAKCPVIAKDAGVEVEDFIFELNPIMQ